MLNIFAIGTLATVMMTAMSAQAPSRARGDQGHR